MPKPRLPYLQKQCGRGKTFWYFRRGHGPRHRIRGAYGSPEFVEAYHAALAGKPVSRSRKHGTFGWLWTEYRVRCPKWRKLAPATKAHRERLMRPVLEAVGNEPIERFTRKEVVAARDRRADRPGEARNFLVALSCLFKWALDAEHIDIDPTRGVAKPALSGDGHHTWTSDEGRRFESFWAVGTRERLLYDIIAWTGLRIGDAVRLGPSHIVDGVITIETEKRKVVVAIPILPPLIESLTTAPLGSETFVTNAYGRKFKNKHAAGNWFNAACRAAGVPGTAHGIRKAFATALSEAGSTDKQLDATMAWRGGGMSSLYTRKADNKKLAAAAMNRLRDALTSRMLGNHDEQNQ